MGRRHVTPTTLDELFERQVIEKWEYRRFWEYYWRTGRVLYRPRDVKGRFVRLRLEAWRKRPVVRVKGRFTRLWSKGKKG